MYLKDLTILVVFCIALTRCLVSINGQKTEKDLEYNLFVEKNYDKYVRPVKRSGDIVPVKVQLTPLALREVDDKFHILEMDSWLTVQWEDQYLTWNPSEYGGLFYLRVPSNRVWLPDLGINPGTPDTSVFPSLKPKVTVNSTGDAVWQVPFSMRSKCPELKLGQQKVACRISLTSWSYDLTQLDIRILNPTDMQYFEDTYPGWHVKSILTYRVQSASRNIPETFVTIDFKINLQRRS